jgi:hypothetical protein
MTSARKIAANRRNAVKSTGPRGAAAKHRTRRNAERHGLARITFDADRLARVEALAQELAGATSDFITLELARAIARAELDIEQIHRVKAGLINTAALSMTIATTRGEALTPDPLAAAIAQVLPELVKIDRYERQAAVRRDRALRDLLCRRRS